MAENRGKQEKCDTSNEEEDHEFASQTVSLTSSSPHRSLSSDPQQPSDYPTQDPSQPRSRSSTDIVELNEPVTRPERWPKITGWGNPSIEPATTPYHLGLPPTLARTTHQNAAETLHRRQLSTGRESRLRLRAPDATPPRSNDGSATHGNASSATLQVPNSSSNSTEQRSSNHDSGATQVVTNSASSAALQNTEDTVVEEQRHQVAKTEISGSVENDDTPVATEPAGMCQTQSLSRLLTYKSQTTSDGSSVLVTSSNLRNRVLAVDKPSRFVVIMAVDGLSSVLHWQDTHLPRLLPLDARVTTEIGSTNNHSGE